MWIRSLSRDTSSFLQSSTCSGDSIDVPSKLIDVVRSYLRAVETSSAGLHMRDKQSLSELDGSLLRAWLKRGQQRQLKTRTRMQQIYAISQHPVGRTKCSQQAERYSRQQVFAAAVIASLDWFSDGWSHFFSGYFYVASAHSQDIRYFYRNKTLSGPSTAK